MNKIQCNWSLIDIVLPQAGINAFIYNGSHGVVERDYLFIKVNCLLHERECINEHMQVVLHACMHVTLSVRVND